MIFLVADEFEGNGDLGLTGVLSAIFEEVIDVELEIKSLELCGLKSLLVLLSFKLRRRTGF